MSKVIVTIEGLREFERAVQRNPAKVKKEVGIFLQRGMAAYKRILNRSPWRVGERGGGIPTDTTKMKQHHQKVKIRGFTASIGPDLKATPYAVFVHGDSPRPVKVRGKNLMTRPWLNFAKEQADSEITRLSEDMLENVRDNLAK